MINILPDYHLLLAAILSPLIAALFIAGGLRGNGARLMAFVGFALPLAFALHAWYWFPPNNGSNYHWLATYDLGLGGFGIYLTLGLNGIALPLYVLTGVVGFAAGLYALQVEAERRHAYLALLLVMQAGLLGVFSSVDVFFLYFFHELALIPTFIMVNIWGGNDRSYAAMKMAIYLTLGAMISLIGIIALWKASGAETFALIELHHQIHAHGMDLFSQKTIAGLLILGFGILVSLWPLHTWAPLAYTQAPSSVAMLHAGVLKKFGLYALIQIVLPLLPAGFEKWAFLMALLAVLGNVIIMGFVTIAQNNLKAMVSTSSVMHMGYAFLGIAACSVLGIGGAVLMMVGHGLSVALMFLLSTCVYRRTQTFDMSEMGGLARETPVLAAFFVLGTFASIGLPGFANFWGELTIFTAAWAFSPLLTVLAVAGIILSAVYGLRAAARVFFGEHTPALTERIKKSEPRDLRWSERVPVLILAIALLGIGFYPKSLSTPLNNALGDHLPQSSLTPSQEDIPGPGGK